MPKKILCEGIAESLTSGIIYIWFRDYEFGHPSKIKWQNMAFFIDLLSVGNFLQFEDERE